MVERADPRVDFQRAGGIAVRYLDSSGSYVCPTQPVWAILRVRT